MNKALVNKASEDTIDYVDYLHFGVKVYVKKELFVTNTATHKDNTVTFFPNERLWKLTFNLQDKV